MKAVSDARAERLERQGLWRRAATRWLAVMFRDFLNNAEREWLRRRRNYCLSMITRAEEARFTASSVNRAASNTRVKMGAGRPNGETFRVTPSGAGRNTAFRRRRHNSDLFAAKE